MSAPRNVVTDTTLFWSIDGLIHASYGDYRARECLLLALDYLLDPRRKISCLFPSLTIGEGSIVPEVYTALKRAGVLYAEDRISADKYQLSEDTLIRLFDVFKLWCLSQADYPRIFLKLHLHPSVIDGWKYRVPLDGVPEDFRGIPYFIYEFCKSRVQDEVDELIRGMGWSLYNVMFLFSIVARGLQYDLSAHALDADYVTHPIRWLGPSWELAPNPQKRAVLVPLGSIVAAAWLEAQYKDFDVLATYIGEIRERAIAYNELWEGKITEYKAIEKVERSLVEGILPGRLSDTVLSKLREYSAVLGALLAAAVGGVPGAVTGILATWYLKKWVDLLRDVQVGPSIAGKPFVRSYMNYPRLEHLGYAICSRCGTETLMPTCPVCKWQERKDVRQRQ